MWTKTNIYRNKILPLTWAVFGLRKKGGEMQSPRQYVFYPPSLLDPNSRSQAEMASALRGSPVRGQQVTREKHKTLRHQHWLVLFGGMMNIRWRGEKGTSGGRELAPLAILRMLSWHSDFSKQNAHSKVEGEIRVRYCSDSIPKCMKDASSSFGKTFGNLSSIWFHWNLSRLNMTKTFYLEDKVEYEHSFLAFKNTSIER